jgi:hypothetical protein
MIAAMPWRGHAADVCKRCGRPVSECGPLSARYRCVDCGEGEMIHNVRELKAHTGPRFLRWRRGVAAGVGAILVDELELDEEGTG